MSRQTRKIGRIAGATVAASAAVALTALPAVADALGDGGSGDGGYDSSSDSGFGSGGIDSSGDTGFAGDYGGGIADSPGLTGSPGGIGADADFSNPETYSPSGNSISTSDINSEMSSGGGGSGGGSTGGDRGGSDSGSGGGDFGSGGIDSFSGSGDSGSSSSSYSGGIADSPGLTGEPGGISRDVDFGDPEPFDGTGIGDIPWQAGVASEDADFSDPESISEAIPDRAVPPFSPGGFIDTVDIVAMMNLSEGIPQREDYEDGLEGDVAYLDAYIQDRRARYLSGYNLVGPDADEGWLGSQRDSNFFGALGWFDGSQELAFEHDIEMAAAEIMVRNGAMDQWTYERLRESTAINGYRVTMAYRSEHPEATREEAAAAGNAYSRERFLEYTGRDIADLSQIATGEYSYTPPTRDLRQELYGYWDQSP